MKIKGHIALRPAKAYLPARRPNDKMSHTFSGKMEREHILFFDFNAVKFIIGGSKTFNYIE
jgi:hypothetical protein